jgi:hypothetical protein
MLAEPKRLVSALRVMTRVRLTPACPGKLFYQTNRASFPQSVVHLSLTILWI